MSGARLPGADLAHDNLSAIDLTNANLRHADLSGAALNSAYLSRSNLSRANLKDASLPGAALNRADLSGACLRGADLRGADLSFADLSSADLTEANLAGADLRETNLTLADLSRACLSDARLTATLLDVTNLTGADLRRAALVRAGLDTTLLGEAVLEMTLFGDCDLSQALGLETMRHVGPSIIGLDTLARSRGLIPPEFLRRAGVAEPLVAIQEGVNYAAKDFCRVLLVGSVNDADFVRKLEADLNRAGFPCWHVAVDDEAAFSDDAGESLLGRFVYYDQPLLVCSEASLGSPYGWRSFEQVAHGPGGASGGANSPVSLTLDDRIDDREDTLCADLRRGTVVAFRGWAEAEPYRESLARLVAVLAGQRETVSNSGNSSNPDWPEPIAPPGD